MSGSTFSIPWLNGSSTPYQSDNLNNPGNQQQFLQQLYGSYQGGAQNQTPGLADLLYAQQQQQLQQMLQQQQQTNPGANALAQQPPPNALGQQPAWAQQFQPPQGPQPQPAPSGADIWAQALGVPTQQAMMQQWDPGQYGQPGNSGMWQQVQGLLGAGGGGAGGGGRG